MTWDEYYETNVKFWLEHPDGIVADFTPDEIEIFWRAAWEEANTPTSVYAVDPATGKTCTEVERINDRYGFIYSDGTALYGQIDMGLQPDATAACRLDLTTAQAEEFTLLPSERIIDLYDGGIMTARYVADAPLPTDWEMFCAAIQTATVEFDRWDPRTNERTKLAERPYNGADVLTSGYAATDGSLSLIHI